MNKIEGDTYITGTLTAGAMNVPASSVGNTEIEAQANISASKLEHQHNLNVAIFDHATDVSARRVGFFRAESNCTIDKFAVYVTVAAGATTTVSVDLLKNGTTILTGTISITNSHTAYQIVEGTLSSSTLVADDVLEVNVTISGTNEPKGLNACAVIRERGY